MEIPDEELVAAYLAGDESSFASLVQRHLKSVYSFAVHSVGDAAEDIAQDTFLKAWKNLRRYDPRSAKFKTWLLRIARNTIIDHLRRKKSFVFSDLGNEHDDTFADRLPDTSPLPDEILAHAQETQTLAETLDTLPPAQREVLLLRYMNQLSFEEIGEVLDEPPSTVRSRHHRGLAELRKRLQQKAG